jgi:hypothetical protein
MNLTTVTPEQKSLIILKMIADELQPIVKELESQPKLTKNHYGQYMSILSKYEGKQRKVYAAALIIAGANREGVNEALNLL